MNNTPFGMNVYYVQRTFSEDSKNDKEGKDSFWKKHKKKILAGAALAGAGALGALGYANKDKIANVFTSDPESKPAPTPIGKSAKQALTTATQWVEKLTFANDDDWVIDLDIIAKNLEIAAKDEGTRTQALLLRDKVVRMIDGDLTKIEQRRPSVTDPAKLKKADMLLQMAKAQRNRLVSIQ